MPKNVIKRKSINDKFYTKPEVALRCINTASPFLEGCNIVEPSSGNGAFSSQIGIVTEFDLEPPENSSATKGDFLGISREQLPEGNLAFIGNPPFGSRNTLTKAFIKKCLSFDDTKVVAFILPKVFNKWGMQRVFTPNWKLAVNEELPEESFLLEGNPYHVPCMFQVWTQAGGMDLRELPPKTESDLFSITSSYQKGIFIFGASPGKVISSEDVDKNNRGYFLSSSIDTQVLIGIIKDVDWKSLGNSSVNGGVSWFTKGEIIKHIEDCYYEKFERV